jgi:CDP-paratose 2-epimerase
VAAEGGDRPNDVPWLVLDTALARETWGFAPRRRTADVLEEILRHARENPAWLELSAGS